MTRGALTQVDKDAFVEWVQREKLPAYLPFTDDNQEVIFNSGIKINVRVGGSNRVASHADGEESETDDDTFCSTERQAFVAVLMSPRHHQRQQAWQSLHSGVQAALRLPVSVLCHDR